MRPNKPVSLDILLSTPGSPLERLVRKAAAGDALTRLTLDLLPKDLARHLVAVSTRDNALVLMVDSAAWAPRFRFLDDELRAALAEHHGLALARLVVRVRPA